MSRIRILCLLGILCLLAITKISWAENPEAAIVTPQSDSVSAPEQTQIPAVDVVKLKSGESRLTVGHYDELPPFYYVKGSPQFGFGYDIFMEVAKKAGIKNVEFVAFENTADLNSKLQQGKIDVIAHSWDLPGTRKAFLLTDPYYTKGGLSFLYFKEKGSFQTAEDLLNHKVGVFKNGYAEHYWLPTHNIPKTAIRSYDTLKDLMFALKDGNIDVAVVYYPLAQLAQLQLTDQLATTLVQSINDVYALRKQDIELQKTLNEAIESLSKDGQLTKISSQYLEPSAPIAQNH